MKKQNSYQKNNYINKNKYIKIKNPSSIFEICCNSLLTLINTRQPNQLIRQSQHPAEIRFFFTDFPQRNKNLTALSPDHRWPESYQLYSMESSPDTTSSPTCQDPYNESMARMAQIMPRKLKVSITGPIDTEPLTDRIP